MVVAVLVGMLFVAIQGLMGAGVALAANPTANAGGPYAGDEGSAVTFSGDGSDAEDATNLLTFEWDFDRQGSFTVDASGVNLTSTSNVYTDNGTFTVALRVTDTQG